MFRRFYQKTRPKSRNHRPHAKSAFQSRVACHTSRVRLGHNRLLKTYMPTRDSRLVTRDSLQHNHLLDLLPIAALDQHHVYAVAHKILGSVTPAPTGTIWFFQFHLPLQHPADPLAVYRVNIHRQVPSPRGKTAYQQFLARGRIKMILVQESGQIPSRRTCESRRYGKGRRNGGAGRVSGTDRISRAPGERRRPGWRRRNRNTVRMCS